MIKMMTMRMLDHKLRETQEIAIGNKMVRIDHRQLVMAHQASR